jgi:hypothetical protein
LTKLVRCFPYDLFLGTSCYPCSTIIRLFFPRHDTNITITLYFNRPEEISNEELKRTFVKSGWPWVSPPIRKETETTGRCIKGLRVDLGEAIRPETRTTRR